MVASVEAVVVAAVAVAAVEVAAVASVEAVVVAAVVVAAVAVAAVGESFSKTLNDYFKSFAKFDTSTNRNKSFPTSNKHIKYLIPHSK